MSSGANFGMMEGAYFVGRVELLAWLNDFLKLNYKKIEQCCSAVAYLQIMDALHPGKVALHKVNFDAKFEYDFIKNFALLQAVFESVGIEKRIDVPTLVKGKFQDNLEFCQWMKKYFDMHYTGEEYDAVGRRNAAIKAQGGKVPKSPGGGTSIPKKKATGAPAAKPASNVKAAPSPVKKAVAPAAKPAAPAQKKEPFPGTAPAKSSEGQSAKIQKLEEELEEFKKIATELENERDFYFKKLRQVEIACQEDPDQPLAVKIFGILSSTDETEETVGDQDFTLSAEDEALIQGAEVMMDDDESF